MELTGRDLRKHKSTSRENRDEKDGGGPFQRFLEAAGRLVEPHFNGRRLARLVHEQRRDGRKPAKSLR